MHYDILFVDDEEMLLKAFERLARSRGRKFASARTGKQAIEFFSKNTAAVALMDVNLPELSGIQLLEYVRAHHLDTETVLMTGKGSVATAVEALRIGAYDYLTKPFEDIERVFLVIDKAMEKGALLRKIKILEEGTQKGNKSGEFHGLIGQSPKMAGVYRLIEDVAASTSNVLILGESGTGKELVARAIYERSNRCDKPFVVINCSAVPETLLESELFGYEKGAFTGAVTDKKGLFEEADQGVILLDEIGEISLPVQVKLLRVLQDGEVRRVGGTKNIHVDVRILSATNKDLNEQVRKKLFREDLFYRLNVINVTIPPLRERREDIPSLAYYFLNKYAEKSARKSEGGIQKIIPEALHLLQEYRWPGNVRELENAIERAVVLAQGPTITTRELPPKLLGEFFYIAETGHERDIVRLPYRQAKQKALNLFNRAYIANLLRQTLGNVSQASDKAGMDRSNFKKILKKCDLSLREFKNRGLSR